MCVYIGLNYFHLSFFLHLSLTLFATIYFMFFDISMQFLDIQKLILFDFTTTTNSNTTNITSSAILVDIVSTTATTIITIATVISHKICLVWYCLYTIFGYVGFIHLFVREVFFTPSSAIIISGVVAR